MKYLISEEATRKRVCEEDITYSLTSKVIGLAPLFKRFLGVNVTAQGMAEIEGERPLSAHTNTMSRVYYGALISVL